MPVSTILYVFLALLVLGVCMLVHELGHFLVARACGLNVMEFAIGMGPALVKWRRGETDYAIRLLPIGGYCMFYGESPDDEAVDPRNINLQAAWKRLLMTFAGPFMNFVLALVLAVVLMSVVGEYVVSSRVESLTPGAPAQTAGIEVGDRVIGLNGEEYTDVNELSAALQETGGDDVLLTVLRGEKTLEMKVGKRYDEEAGRWLMGLSFGVERQNVGLFTAMRSSVDYCIELFKAMIDALRSIFSPEVLDSVAGPVGTVSMMTEYTQESFAQSFNEGISMLLNLAVIITMNLGLMNLLPLPALDGGRLVFLLFETVTGRHVNRKAEAIVHFVGLVLLLLLMLVVTYSDIRKFFV